MIRHYEFEKIGESCYLHIENGGVSFTLFRASKKRGKNKDAFVPIIEISSHHFGVQTNQMLLPLTPEIMLDIANWFSDASFASSNFGPIDKYDTGFLKRPSNEFSGDNIIIFDETKDDDDDDEQIETEL